MEILLFGGSFDPPHLGHVALLKAAIRRLKPDLTYVFPAYRSPLKPGARAGTAERLAMARLAFRGLPVIVHPFELERGRTTYTYQTLRFLRRRHPGARLTALVGSDAYASLPAWKRPAELRASTRWLVGRRPGPFTRYSSSDLRLGLLSGEAAPRGLDPAVARYVARRGLYGGALRRRLRRSLPPPRFEHTLAVAHMAARLCLRHGLDGEKGVLAALLHDCARGQDPRALARYCSRFRVAAPAREETSRENPALLHAYVSADLARRVYGVDDPQILSAVRKHTLGALAMSPLDVLLYVADACSLDRRHPQARLIRREALRDLARALRLAVRAKLAYALRDGAWLHPLAGALWNQLRRPTR